MSSAFWKRPVPPWAKWTLIGSLVALLLITALIGGIWAHYHWTYAHWLKGPPEPLTGHAHRLIIEGEFTSTTSEDEVAACIDEHLRHWRDDRERIAELSRSDILTFSLLGRAYARVFLRTHLPEEGVDQSVEFVTEFVRDGDTWRHRETYNLAVP
ncbi:hypothetical protein JXA47_13565 [Candidatus Sumerlaeota bacterium]|nr:hypothetical protein [Candidatus Sumerlaeota bacterium]